MAFMKKKNISIILIVILLVAAITGVFFFAKSRTTSNSNSTDEIIYEDEIILPILRSNTLNELEDYVNRSGVELHTYDEGIYEGFDGISIGDMSVSAIFHPDSENIVSTSVVFESSVIFDDELESPEESLKFYLNRVNAICSSVFGIDTTEFSHIYHSEGYILEENGETYKEFLENNAIFQLSVRETDNSLWKISGYMQEEHFVMYMDRYFNSDAFVDVSADVTLQ